MATVSEFTSLVGLFVEALQVLQADKSEVVQAQEALAAAQSALAKEEADVGGSSAGLVSAWEGVKAAGDALVAELLPPLPE
jgi:cysteine synthase